MYTVYKVSSPSNKVYIGITKNGLSRRKTQHISRSKTSNLPFHNAIKKYGSKLVWEIISSKLSKDQAISMEIELVSKYKKLQKSYNISDGGDGVTGYQFTEKDKLKILQGMDPKNLVNSNELKLKKALSKGAQPFDVYSLDGEHLGTWINMRECARYFSIPKPHIWRVLNGRRKSAYGMTFEYKDQE